VVADNSESGATTSTRIEDGERNPQIIPGQKSASRKSTQKSARRRLTDSKPMVMSIARVAEWTLHQVGALCLFVDMVSWSNGIAYFTSESASPGIHKLDWFREIGFVNCSARGPIGKVPALCHTTELKYLGVPPFRIGVFLMHKGDATETAH
jgi:hypothetical protein